MTNGANNIHPWNMSGARISSMRTHLLSLKKRIQSFTWEGLPRSEQAEFKKLQGIVNEYDWYHSLKPEDRPLMRSGSLYLIKQIDNGKKARGGPVTSRPLLEDD